ncbi:hypothetical protein FRC18_006635 [Serendipita sp. 400]|nr:hypothetical protein FRC18_006635 [Serendipita sp. 400]
MVSIPLRSPGTLEKDDALKEYLENGKLVLYACDATKVGDVTKVWNAANERAIIDLVFFGIGPALKFQLSKIAQGGLAVPPNVSTVSFLNVVQAIASGHQAVEPKLVVFSAAAVTPSALSAEPLPLRLIAPWAFRGPNLDKRGMEAVVFHGWSKPYEEGMTPTESDGILPPNWKQMLPKDGWAKHAVIIRPPGLTDGKETGKYKAKTKTFRTFRMSRRDLARFVTKDLVDNWSKFEGHIVAIG